MVQYVLVWCVACVRCPTTDVLDLLFYSANQLSWGVRFAVPKYQAFDSLFIACSAFICDSSVKKSTASCDRSCVPATTTTTTTTAARRRRRGLTERRQQVQTEFTVLDRGFGPVIDSDGQIRLIRHSSQLPFSSFIHSILNSLSHLLLYLRLHCAPVTFTRFISAITVICLQRIACDDRRLSVSVDVSLLL